MNNVNKGKVKYSFLLVTATLMLLLTLFCRAELFDIPIFHNSLTSDTVPRPKPVAIPTEPVVKPTGNGNLNPEAPLNKKTQTTTVVDIDTIPVRFSKDSLDAPVVYHADDSMVLDVPAKKIFLYGTETKVTYQDNVLTAPGIVYDQNKNTVSAYALRDSTGNVLKFAKFVQGDFISYSDSMRFNLVTGKGQTKRTYFQQNEMFVQTEASKKVDSNTIYGLNTKFTTCNLDTPHFAFVSHKVKFINKKIAFTGPVHPEIEGVPLPIVFPFGIYPLKQGRHSGILAPSFNVNEQLGFSLDGIGYYKVLSDNWDAAVRGTLYSYGGWTASLTPRYFKRYRYNGDFSFNIQHLNYGLKTDPDFNKSRTFKIGWSHNVDTKARPGVTFRAYVEAGSSKYNQAVPGRPTLNFDNRLYSSIAYSKMWTSNSKLQTYNLSVNANHEQNAISQQINITLPDLTFSVNTQYPFRRKEAVDLKWYENIGIGLQSSFRNVGSFSDSSGAPSIFTQIRNNYRWGATHSVPISLTLPPLGALQVSPSVSYSEKWYQRKLFRTWNTVKKKQDTTYQSGFFTARDMSFNLDFNTRIFGMFTFGKNSKVMAIRHEIRPQMGFSYHPDFNSQFYRKVQADSFGRYMDYSLFEGSIPGTFGNSQSGAITFGVDNILQMKVRNKKDTGEAAIKKISLLDVFSINGAYDLLRDSFPLSNLSLTASTHLFDKINITASGFLDPYDTDTLGYPSKNLIWKRKPISLGRLSSFSVSMTTSFKGGSKGKEAEKKDPATTVRQYDPNTGMPLDEYQQELAYIQNNPAEFADFSIPWSVNLSYSLNYNNTRNAGYGGFIKTLSQSTNISGDLNLTPKWKIGLSGSYNISLKELGVLSMYLSREMHCWQMAINIAPVGHYRFFSINISPKSALLRDLKVNRTRSFFD